MRHNTSWPVFLFLIFCFEISAASAQNARLYVDNSDGDHVSVIDLDAEHRLAPWPRDPAVKCRSRPSAPRQDQPSDPAAARGTAARTG